MRKTAVFITVRTDSHRLPRKCFMHLNGKMVIQHVIDRAKAVLAADCIVICTTDRDCDHSLELIAEVNGIFCYRGSLEDKLDRWLGAAKQFEITHFVTFDADDPFCDPHLMAAGLLQTQETGKVIKSAPGMICGAFTYAIPVTSLEKVVLNKIHGKTEMIDSFFPDAEYLDETDLCYYDSRIRLTLDYEEDLKFFVTLFNEMQIELNIIPLSKIIAWLMNHYVVIEINSHLMEKWKENQRIATIGQGA